MTRVFLGWFVAGLVLAVVGIMLMPLPQPARFRAELTVEPDGGRREEFVLRWPDDRIELPTDRRNPPGAADAAGAAVLEDSASQRASAELFRLRDAANNVIGVASRLSNGGATGTGPSTSHWMLVIPGRGSLFLVQTDSDDLRAAQRAGEGRRVASPAQQAVFWLGRRRFTATAGNSGVVARGTREFAGFTGAFTETWAIKEASAQGTRGEIRLVTVTRGGR